MTKFADIGDIQKDLGMPKRDSCILVLWAAGFQEATATIFVTELRQAGLRVKVIGSTRQQIKGSHGLALVPDLTLAQAQPLLTQATHFIIPTTLVFIQHLQNDPCLTAFFEQVDQHQIPVLIGGDEAETTMFLKSRVMVFPVDTQALVEFVRGVGEGEQGGHR